MTVVIKKNNLCMKLIIKWSVSKTICTKEIEKNMLPKYIKGLLFGFKRIISLLFVRATLGCQEWLQYYTDREGCVVLSMVQLSGSHLREMIVVTLVSCDKTITVSGSAGGGRAAGRRAQVKGDILACSGSVTSSGARDERGNEKLGVRVEGQEDWNYVIRKD